VINILHVYRTYFPETQGGAQEVIRQICLNSKPLGVQSKVFAPSRDLQPRIVQSKEADIHRVHLDFEIASCGFCFTGINEFKRLVDWADIVHYHFPWPFADLLHFVCRVSKPSLLTYHSDIVRQERLLSIYGPLMGRFLDAVDTIVCTSPNYLKTSLSLSTRQAKTRVVPIGIDAGSYPSISSDKLAALQTRHGNDFFLFVGLLRYYKGLHILLNALVNSKVRVVIAGAGPVEKELKDQSTRLGLTNVQFAGYVSEEDKVGLLQLCRGVVFPSHLRSEAFGVTLLEGAMFGKPLISTETGTGTSYVNVNDVTGFVVQPGNAYALREAMNKINNNYDLASRLGAAARERYQTLFTGEQMARGYLEQYRRLLDRP
jgi:rhamnosyl/mannosyltransferase